MASPLGLVLSCLNFKQLAVVAKTSPVLNSLAKGKRKALYRKRWRRRNEKIGPQSDSQRSFCKIWNLRFNYADFEGTFASVYFWLQASLDFKGGSDEDDEVVPSVPAIATIRSAIGIAFYEP